MKYIFDNDLHIHSKISLCSNDDSQNNERILQYAKNNNLKVICLTDHFWDSAVDGASVWYQKQDYEHICMAKPLPQTDGIKFLFGCEAEMDKNMNVGISKGLFDKFDFIVIPTTHFHMKGFAIPENVSSPEEKAEFWVKKLNALLDKDLPFYKIGIAHLTCSLIDSCRDNFLKTIDAVSDEDMKSVFTKAAKKGVGIELNSADMKFKDEEADTVLRPYRIAKRMGCKFYCGSDAHHPAHLDAAKMIFERAINYLELTEDDKFHIL